MSSLSDFDERKISNKEKKWGRMNFVRWLWAVVIIIIIIIVIF
jgi:hypothetical protein